MPDTTEMPNEEVKEKPKEALTVDKEVNMIKGGNSANTKVNRIAILCLLLIVSIGMLPIMKMFFVPILLAAAFATLCYPLYLRLQKTFKNRAVSSLFCCVMLFLCCVIPLYIVMHLVLTQLITFYQSAEPVVREIVTQGANSSVIKKLQALPLLQTVNISAINISGYLKDFLKAFVSVGSGALNKTSAGVFGFVTDILIMFFTMFYFFMDGESLIKRIKYLSPIRDDYEDLIFSRFLLISRATVFGTLMIGLTQGTLGALALLLFGIKSWLLWGFVMVILSLIPMVGAWMVLIPAGCIQLLTGHPWQGIGILIISTAVISNVDNLLRPRLVGKGAKLHDLVIFFSSLGGIAIFGVMGFIVGPVIAALFFSVLDIYSTEFQPQLELASQTANDIPEESVVNHEPAHT